VKKIGYLSRIDIILPNYNSSKYLDYTIRSVINQSYKNWKLIIVDDNSDPKTLAVLKKYSKKKNIKIYYQKKNRGAAYCRNLALKRCKSKFIAFIDSDDVWHTQKIEKQLNFMKKNNYKFTYTNYTTLNEQKKIKKITIPKIFTFENFVKNTSIATSTMIVERKITNNIKFTDTKVCEDFFFKCQLLKKTKYAYCLNQYLMKYRIRKDSLQSKKLRNLYWIWKINKIYNKFNFLNNFLSIFFISLNSIKKYGLR